MTDRTLEGSRAAFLDATATESSRIRTVHKMATAFRRVPLFATATTIHARLGTKTLNIYSRGDRSTLRPIPVLHKLVR